jgi:hypothetical protein
VRHVRFTPNSGNQRVPLVTVTPADPIFMKKVRCCVSYLTSRPQPGQYIIRNTNCHVHDYRERQMSYEFDRRRIEQVIVLSGLVLFLALAALIPA